MQQSTLKFLAGLKKNNNKDWFESHRTEYEAAKKDFESFIESLINLHSKKDTDIKGLQAKKCIFRINRDIRFSKDKSPYKTNFGASMDKGGRKSGLAGYYFHIEPGESFLAGGLWMPMPDRIKKVRQEIDYSFDEFQKITSSKKFKSFFGELYSGEDIKLSKVPAGFDKQSPAAEYLKFKSWLVMSPVTDKEILSNDLLKKAAEGFVILQPFIRFLNQAME